MSNVRPPVKFNSSVVHSSEVIVRLRPLASAQGVRPAAATEPSDRLARTTNASHSSSAKFSWESARIQCPNSRVGSVVSQAFVPVALRRTAAPGCWFGAGIGFAHAMWRSRVWLPGNCQVLAVPHETREVQSPIYLCQEHNLRRLGGKEHCPGGGLTLPSSGHPTARLDRSLRQGR